MSKIKKVELSRKLSIARNRPIIYQAQDKQLTTAFDKLIKSMAKHEGMEEATQILKNLKNARTNYRYAYSIKCDGGNKRIGSYTKSFRNAISAARRLYKNLANAAPVDMFSSYNVITEYIHIECKGV